MKTFVTATLVVILLSMAAILGLSAVGRGGANSNGLPQAFNNYRASIGRSALTEVAVLDAAAQGGSDNSCAQGGYILPSSPLSGSWTIWMVYGYNDAASVLAAELTDSYITGKIADPNANAIGVGVNTSCGQIGILWTIILGHATVLPTGVTPTTPPPTSTPIVSATPIHTPTTPTTTTPGSTPTPISTGTSNGVCIGPTAVTFAGSIICYCSDGAGGLTVCFIGHTTPPTAPPTSTTPTPTLPATTPTPTQAGPVVGDLNCDGQLTAVDALIILQAIAMDTAIAPC